MKAHRDTLEQLRLARSARRTRDSCATSYVIARRTSAAAITGVADAVRRGVRIRLQGHQPFMAAARAVRDTLRALRDGVQPERLEGIASDEAMKRLMRSAQYTRWSNDWL